MVYIIFAVIYFLIWNLPDWIANVRYNNCDTSNVNIGKMVEDKYKNNLSNTQVKNNIASGKYNRDR